MKQIGDYEVLGLLGKGGMSRVYKVRHPMRQEIAALKLLSPHPHLLSLLGLHELKKRFASEAAIMAEVDSPHIVRVLDEGQHDGQPFIVMEYLCHNLGEVIGETYRVEDPARALRVDKSIRFARQILLGLSRLHERGIVHRDVKPFNVLLTEDETVRLTDFGLSKVRGETFAGPRQLIVGSPYYGAPEQEAEPDRADLRADLYSVGVVLHRMLTGLLPQDEPESLGSVSPALDASWDAFLAKAMSPDKNCRFATAEEMLRELDGLEARWEEQMEKTCTHWEVPSPSSPRAPSLAGELRTRPLKVAPRDAAVTFGLDALSRPRLFLRGRFVDNGDGTVAHESTRLVWERKGSGRTLTWREAHHRVQRLNEARFAGRSCWRLPTVEELMSLLTPVPDQDDYCIEPIFGKESKWMWSSDRCSFTSAWYVSAEMGYVSRLDFTCRLFVRAVASQPPSTAQP